MSVIISYLCILTIGKAKNKIEGSSFHATYFHILLPEQPLGNLSARHWMDQSACLPSLPFSFESNLKSPDLPRPPRARTPSDSSSSDLDMADAGSASTSTSLGPNNLTADVANLSISGEEHDSDHDHFVEVDSDELRLVEEEYPILQFNSPPSPESRQISKTASSGSRLSLPPSPPSEPSQSALDQVLQNEDLLHLIFSFLHPYPDRWTFRRLSSPPPVRPPKFLLVPVALTCKAFFMPAIRVLWFESSILSLLRVIPVLVRRGKMYFLNGVITEQHMQRFDLYASCIRRLHSFSFNVKVSSQVFTIISRLRFPTLLPAVRQLKFLSIHNTPLENLNSLFLVKSSTLTDIQIGRIDATSEVLVASFLAQVVVNVETLDLRGRLTEVTFGVLPKFERLRGLWLEIQSPQIGARQVDFLGSCAQIKTLGMLWLNVHPDFRYTAMSTAAAEFPALVTLVIAARMDPMMDILSMLRTIQLPRLGTIRLNFRPTEVPLDRRLSPCLERCVQIAQARAFPFALTLEGTITARWADLAPLRKLENVVGLHILFEALSVVNDDMERFFGGAGRWSMLKKLIISYCNTPLAPNALQWAALGVIARNCPRLVSLVVSIQVGTVPEVIQALKNEISTTRRCTDSNVASLTIQTAQHYDENLPKAAYSVVGAAVVSRYIHHCFPNLKEIKLRDSSNLDWCMGVERMVMNYQEIQGSTA